MTLHKTFLLTSIILSGLCAAPFSQAAAEAKFLLFTLAKSAGPEVSDDIVIPYALAALSKGADSNATNAQGKTPLHVVNNPCLAQLLIGFKAQLETPGQTPLIYATTQALLSNPLDTSVVEVLLRNGANKNAMGSGSLSYIDELRTEPHVSDAEYQGWLPHMIANAQALVALFDSFPEQPNAS